MLHDCSIEWKHVMYLNDILQGDLFTNYAVFFLDKL